MMFRQVHHAIGGCVVATLLLNPGSVVAGNFDDWCLPANDCTGEPMPINEDTFGTCEERCTLSNPTKIFGLDAFVYEVTCTGDHLPEPSRERQIFMRYRDYQDRVRAVSVDKTNGATELVKCSSPDDPSSPNTSMAPTDSCPLDKTIWSSGTKDELTKFFYTGAPSFFLSGPVTFERWVGDQKSWSVKASIECSNGVPFCNLQLPIMGSGQAESIPVEMVTPDGLDIIEAGPTAGVPFVVFSHLRLSTFRWIKYSVEPKRVSASFEPSMDPNGDVVLPSVYKYSGCIN